MEASIEVDLIGVADEFFGLTTATTSGTSKDAPPSPPSPGMGERFGALSVLANATLLEAEYLRGPFKGNSPRYAPDYIVRTGLIYRWKDRLKVAFLGTFVDESYADDTNSPLRVVPGYAVCDLTMEAKVYKDWVSIQAGVNNLFDQDYYSRITDAGIDPAYGRNYYGGFSVKF